MNLINLFAVSLLSMAFQPSNYSPSRAYPSEVVIVDSSNPLWDTSQYGTTTIGLDESTFTIPTNLILVPTYAYWDYSGDYPLLETISVTYFNNVSSVQSALMGIYAIGYLSTGGSGIVSEYNYGLSYSFGLSQIVQNSVSSTSVSYSVNSSGVISLYSNLTFSTQYTSLTFNTANFLEAISPYVWDITTAHGNDLYNLGYNQGKEDGYGDVSTPGTGYYDGYRAGEIAGAESDPGNIFTDLTGGIVNIPMSILAGLSVFSFFDTPIIGLIITFLLVAIAILVIKRFI